MAEMLSIYGDYSQKKSVSDCFDEDLKISDLLKFNEISQLS